MDNKQIIWIFRERRSGGTWFTMKLCKELKKEYYFVDDHIITSYTYDKKEKYFLERTQTNQDYNRILNTHYFFGLKGICNYTDPIIIRITRRNKTEQFFSDIIAANYNKLKSLHNIYHINDISKLVDIEPHKINENLVYDFINQSQKNEKLWELYSKNLSNETVYYEDLCETYNSTIFPLTNWSMKVSEESLPIKIPYQKDKIFLNYDKIKKIIESYLPTK